MLTLNPDAAWGPSCNATQPYCARAPLALAVSRDSAAPGPLFNVEIDGGGEHSFGYPTARQCTDAAGAPAICLTYSLGGSNHSGRSGSLSSPRQAWLDRSRWRDVYSPQPSE